MTILRTIDAPSLAVCKTLDGQFIDPPGIQLTLGRNLYRSAPRTIEGNVPAQAVFVLTNGGSTPEQYHEDASLLVANVLVYVRSNVNKFAEGEDLARGVLAHMHRTIPAGYIECLSNIPEPEFMGDYNTEQPYWLIQLSLTRKE